MAKSWRIAEQVVEPWCAPETPAMATKWEYEITEVEGFSGTRPMIDEMGQEGWELVSGSTATRPMTEYDGLKNVNIWHTTYTFFWRRPAIR